jgi:hypothetical protein
MKITRVLGVAAAVLVMSGVAYAQGVAQPVMLTPADLKWVESPTGTRVATIKGDQKLPGQVVFRANWPANFRIPPHNHPDERMVTVLSGTYYFALGEVFDESRLKAYPPGSVIIVPPRVSHFGASKDGVEFQEMGTGPTATDLVKPAGTPTK